jgi:TPR repeat protein
MSLRQKILMLVKGWKSDEVNDEEILRRVGDFFDENCKQLDAQFGKELLGIRGPARLDLVKTYAEKGSGVAQWMYGSMLTTGTHLKKDPSAAIFWLKRAYNNGAPRAGMALSAIYANGIGVRENLVKARLYLKQSVDHDVPAAQYSYGVMLLEGEGGEVNEQLGLQYVRAAAEAENEQAMEYLEKHRPSEHD